MNPIICLRNIGMAYPKTFVPLIKQPARTVQHLLELLSSCLSSLRSINYYIHNKQNSPLFDGYNDYWLLEFIKKKKNNAFPSFESMFSGVNVPNSETCFMHKLGILVILFMTKRFNILPNTRNLEEILPF
ncbi:hypothetical protein Peur_045780 [Populus x canadensis]